LIPNIWLDLIGPSQISETNASEKSLFDGARSVNEPMFLGIANLDGDVLADLVTSLY
jgi:hypothetical protein